jgi:hypothetical protein
MNIHQLSVHHDERQDRLMLRLNTQDSQEFRFWLTRRMAQRFLPILTQTAERLEAAQPGVAATDPVSRQILSDLRREDFLKKADFATPFENSATHLPLGPHPMLVTDAHLDFQVQGGLDLTLEDKTDPQHPQACLMHLQVSLVHGLVHLMAQAAEKAQWGLGAGPEPAPDNPTATNAAPTRYAH